MKRMETSMPQVSTSINDLPEEMLSTIFSYLDLQDIVNCIEQTCQSWKDITDREHISFWSRVWFTPPALMREDVIVSYLNQNPQIRLIEFSSSRQTGNIIKEISGVCEFLTTVRYRSKTPAEVDTLSTILKENSIIECFDMFSDLHKMHIDYGKLFGKRYENCRLVMVEDTPTEIRDRLTENKRTIKTLFFTGRFTNDIFRLFSECQELRYLFILNIGKSYENVDFRLLSKLPHLQTLQIKDVHSCLCCKDLQYQVSSQCFPNITKIEIVNGEGVLKKSLNSLLVRCPNLRHLNVQDNFLKDDYLENIKYCKYLEYLDVSKNFELSDRFVTDLASGCFNLKYVDISQCKKVSDAFALILHPCSKLEILRIDGDYFSGSYLCTIPDFYPKLIELHLNHFYNNYPLKTLIKKMPNLTIFLCSQEHTLCVLEMG